MTKKQIIKEIGLDTYYGSKQGIADIALFSCSKDLLKTALITWRANPTAQTREFIGRVLTGIFKFNCAIDEIRN